LEIFPEERKNDSIISEIIINNSQVTFEAVNNEAYSNINLVVRLDLSFNNITSLPSRFGALINLELKLY
jgi:hypothetical protein